MAKAEPPAPSPSPATEVAEGQPFLPQPYQPPSTYAIPLPYVLLPLPRLRLRRPRPSRRCTTSCSLITTITLLLLLLSCSLFLLWPSDPELRVVRLHLDHIRAVTSPIPYLDISMDLRVRVRNPDFFSLRYDSLVTSIEYRGGRLGFVTSGGGEVKARGVSFVAANLRMNGVEVFKDVFYLIEDLARGFIPFDTVTEVDGSIRVFFIDIPIKVKISCAVHVNIKNQAVVHQDCYPE